MRECYVFLARRTLRSEVVWTAPLRRLLATLCCAASLVFSAPTLAQKPSNASNSAPPRLSLVATTEVMPLDRSGAMTGDALLERVQLIVWDRQRIARPAPEGALGAASAELLFGIITGGSGAGQDLAEPKE